MNHHVSPGTDDSWSTPEDFILGITSEVWEQRRVDAILDYYADDVILRSPAAVLMGNGTLVASTLSTLAAFPDREMLSEDVIWSLTRAQQADGVKGFVASHRILSRATHLGAGAYGPASGTQVICRGLADFWCSDGQVRDAWLIEDQAAVLLALGHQPRDWVLAQLGQDGSGAVLPPPLTPDADPDGPYRGTGARGDTAELLAGLLKDVMGGDLSAITRGWDTACELTYPGGTTGHGRRDAEAFWLGLRSAFPSAAFRIDHRIGREDAGRAPRAAVRWSLYGRHDGWGAFGAPSNAYVYVIGITHAEFGPRGLHREWTLIDEVAIWTQIELARG